VETVVALNLLEPRRHPDGRDAHQRERQQDRDLAEQLVDDPENARPEHRHAGDRVRQRGAGRAAATIGHVDEVRRAAEPDSLLAIVSTKTLSGPGVIPSSTETAKNANKVSAGIAASI